MRNLIRILLSVLVLASIFMVASAEEPEVFADETMTIEETNERTPDAHKFEEDLEDELMLPKLPGGNGFDFVDDEEQLPDNRFDPFDFPADTFEGIPDDYRFESTPQLAPEEPDIETGSEDAESPEDASGEEVLSNFRKEAAYINGGEGEGDNSAYDYSFTFSGIEGGYGKDFGGYVKRFPNGEVDSGYGVFLGADGRYYLMEIDVGGRLGSEENNVQSRIVGTVGELGFNGCASVDFSEGYPVVYVGTEVGATAGAIGGQLGGTICSVEVSAEGKVVVGCGIKGYMHFESGKLVIEMGASCGVGFEGSFSIDVGAIYDKFKTALENDYNEWQKEYEKKYAENHYDLLNDKPENIGLRL